MGFGEVCSRRRDPEVLLLAACLLPFACLDLVFRLFPRIVSYLLRAPQAREVQCGVWRCG